MADVEDRVEPGMETESPPTWRRLLASLLRWETLLVVLLLASIAYGASVSPHFLDSTTMFFIGLNVGEIAIIALPLTLIIITGEIDLSVASMLGLTGLFMAELFKHGWPIWPAMIAAVLLGGGARRVQRLPDHAHRPAIARRHDRDTDALPRHRAGDPAVGHDQRIPAGPSRTSASSRSAHAHLVFGRHLPGARGRLRNHPPRDAAGARDLRHRREPGGGLLLRYPRQADQVLALRPLGDDVRPRRCALDAPLCVGPLRLGIGSSCSW